MKLKQRLRKWLGIEEIEVRLNSVLKLVKTDIDCNLRTNSWAVISIEGNRQFVEIYKMPNKDLQSLLEFLRRFDRMNVENIDAPYSSKDIIYKEI
jgi:hypothetical protein